MLRVGIADTWNLDVAFCSRFKNSVFSQADVQDNKPRKFVNTVKDKRDKGKIDTLKKEIIYMCV